MPEYLNFPYWNGIALSEGLNRDGDFPDGPDTPATVALGEILSGEVQLARTEDTGDWFALDLVAGSRMVLGGSNIGKDRNPNFVAGTILDAAGDVLLDLGSLRYPVGFIVPDGAAFLRLTQTTVTTRFDYGGHPHSYRLIFAEDAGDSFEMAAALLPSRSRSEALTGHGTRKAPDTDLFRLDDHRSDRGAVTISSLEHGTARLIDAQGNVMVEGRGDSIVLDYDNSGGPVFLDVTSDARTGYGSAASDIYDVHFAAISDETVDAPGDASTRYSIDGGAEFHGTLDGPEDIDRIEVILQGGAWYQVSLVDGGHQSLKIHDKHGVPIVRATTETITFHYETRTTIFVDVATTGKRGGDY